MKFVSDPKIAIKIRKMQQRVRWQDPQIVARGIDQTQFVLADESADNPEFSFLVVGDSGSGRHRSHNPQRQIAQQMIEHHDSCRFMLHTGDVIYLVGSSEYYHENFINPYREFLVGGEHPEKIAFDQMVFRLPIFPVPGNHDYYDLPFVFGVLAQATLPLRQVFRLPFDLDVGWHGSGQGKAYAQAFIDFLTGLSDADLVQHLDRHYTAQMNGNRCLRYEPGSFTRLPNRYYTFRYGGIDFFALDSNTFNAPQPLPTTPEGQAYRRKLEQRLQELDQKRLEIIANSAILTPGLPDADQELDDAKAKVEQIEESKIDIEKQLTSDKNTTTDFEQLHWLQDKLIESWNTEGVRGRILFFHHPPYVTEATKWDQAQTLAIRRNLRWVLDGVAKTLGSQLQGRRIVDLILNGHAHCLEYLQTGDTGHADSNLHWIVCGGSGYSLRRQRSEGPELKEILMESGRESEQSVARSHLFIGRNGNGSHKHRPYSFLRIDVRDGCPPQFVVRPFICDRFQHQWIERQSQPFTI